MTGLSEKSRATSWSVSGCEGQAMLHHSENRDRVSLCGTQRGRHLASRWVSNTSPSKVLVAPRVMGDRPTLGIDPVGDQRPSAAATRESRDSRETMVSNRTPTLYRSPASLTDPAWIPIRVKSSRNTGDPEAPRSVSVL